MINQKPEFGTERQTRPKTRTWLREKKPAMNTLPTSSAQFPGASSPRDHLTHITYLTISHFFVLFGLIWCCLALFGPKFFIFLATHRAGPGYAVRSRLARLARLPEIGRSMSSAVAENLPDQQGHFGPYGGRF